MNAQMNTNAPIQTPGYWRLLWVLYCKEWFRLKRNPAALMAAGLIVLMAYLVSLENQAIQHAKRQENTPCAVIFSEDSAFIRALKASKRGHTFRFIQVNPAQMQRGLQYETVMRCLVEVRETQTLDGKQAIALTYKAVDGNSMQMAQFNRWLLTEMVRLNPKLELSQQLIALKEAQAAPPAMAKLDLGSQDAKAMIGAMMIFSAQFFMACAMCISFTAYERERGILQALALTTAQPGQMLLAKALFHCSLSVIVSCVIYKVISGMPWMTMLHFAYFFITIFGFSSLGFVAIATLIISVNRTQTTASLVGFCYLMLMGVIFALAGRFQSFAVIKSMLFESHAIGLYTLMLSGVRAANQGLTMFSHQLDVILLTTLLWLLARWVFIRIGWRLR